MIHRRVRLGILCLSLAWSAPVWAGEGAGTESPLLLGTDARILAMGGVAAALGEGPSTLAHNPARLAWLDQGAVSLFHTDLYTPETSLQSGFAAYPTLDLGTFAFGVQRLGVGGIDARDDRNLALGSFEASELHASLGYGHSIRPWLAVGLDLRIVQQKVDSTSATAAGLDLGLAARRPLPRAGHFVELGIAARNLVAPTVRLDQDEVSDPLRLHVGAGYRHEPAGHRLNSALGLETSFASESDARWGLGGEVGFDRLLFLRAGIDTGELTAGLGVRLRGVEFAYAFRNDRELPRDDRFTVSFRFGPSVEQRLEQRRARQEAKVADRLGSLLAQRESEALARARAEADEAWTAQDLSRAEVLYGRVLLLQPDDDTARDRIDDARRRLALQAATAELQSGSAARAATQFQRILDRWPDDTEARAGLRSARDLLERDQDVRGQTRALFSEALDRFTGGDFLGARAALDELARLDAEHEGARDLRVRVEEARIARVDELVSQARAAIARQEYERARSLVQRALVLAPERGPEFDELLEEWARQRAATQRSRALVETPAAPANPAPAAAPLSEERRARLRAWFDEGLRDFEAGDYERATLSWRRVWDVDPSSAEVGDYLVKAHLLLGIQAYTRGDYERALDQCRRALEIEPKNEKARRYVARIEEERSSVRRLDDWSSDE